MKDTDQLRITEIFFSLQGEGLSVGCPTIFIRLTGCPLRCGYCDTKYAFQGGGMMSVAEVIRSVATYPSQRVTVTGGEPMAQKACHKLLTDLCNAGYEVSLETSGSIDLASVDLRVVKVMDIKTPGSGEVEKNRWQNFDIMSSSDVVKIVLTDQRDYEWAKSIISQYRLSDRFEVLLSPAYKLFDLAKLAELILDDGLNVRLQIQLHKMIWGEIPGK